MTTQTTSKAPVAPAVNLADYFQPITVGVGVPLPETHKAVDVVSGLGKLNDEVNAAINTMTTMETKLGAPKPGAVKTMMEKYPGTPAPGDDMVQPIEKGIRSIIEPIATLVSDNNGQIFEVSGITKGEECVRRLAALDKAEQVVKEAADKLPAVMQLRDTILWTAQQNKLFPATHSAAYGESVTLAGNKITEYIEHIGKAFAETRRELNSIHSRFDDYAKPSNSIKFIEHGNEGDFTAYVSSRDLSNVSFTNKQPEVAAAITPAPEAKPADSSASAAAPVTGAEVKPAESPAASTAAPAPDAGVAPAAAAPAPVAPKVAPELLSQFRELNDAIQPPLFERMRAQSDRVAALMQNIAGIKERLDEIAHPVARSIFNPYGWYVAVKDYFDKPRQTKALAKQETLLKEARYGRVEIRQAGWNEVRNIFPETRFTVSKGNPEGIPASILKAAIPLSKANTLISFKSLTTQAAEGAPEGSVSVKEKEGSIQMTVNDKKLAFYSRSDGKVLVFADMDGSGLKRVGSAWNDDALKIAMKFLERGDVTFTKRSPREEERFIPKNGFLDNK